MIKEGNIQQIINEINKMGGQYHPHNIFQDWVEMTGISISNQVYYNEQLEQEYLSIAKKYTNEQIVKFSEMSAHLVYLFEEEISDYLGEIYMKLDASSSRTGQFFTPFHICEMMASISLQNYNGEKLTLNEPSCGGSGNILGIAKVIKEKGYNYQELINVVAQDLDYKCVWMSYVQLSIGGVNAKVIQGNTLKDEVNRVLYTPMYVLKGGSNER